MGIIFLKSKILHFDEINVVVHEDLKVNRSLSNILLSGNEIQENMKSTLAATLSNEVGLAVSSMGQATARPVLRGYSGDRFLLTDGGIELGDLSQTSVDHAVSMDMASAQNIEIIRGAKTLLYGPNTIGGVIDIKKNAMPELKFSHPHLHGVIGGESVNKGFLSNITYHYPFRNQQIRFSFLNRNSGNQSSPIGFLKNTSSINNELAAGIAHYGDKERFGISFESLNMDYGIPGSEEGHIDGVDIVMKKITQKLNYHRDISFLNFKTLDLDQRFINYKHDEFETSQTFASVKLKQQFFSLQGKFSGADRAIGSLLQFRNFNAGGFYWTPDTQELNFAIFTFREKEFKNIVIQGSIRYEMLIIKPNAKNLTMSNLDPNMIKERRFNFNSYMLSFYKNLKNWKISTNLMLTYRAPGIEDLFSDGPHLGSYSYEIGQPMLKLEQTKGVESSLAYQKNKFSANLTGFINYSPNYHLSSKMGDKYVPGADWIEWGSGSSGWLYKYQMVGIESRISGLELASSYQIDLLTISADYSNVFGKNISQNQPLSFMPPAKSRLKFSYNNYNNFSYAIQIVKGFSQDKIGEFETKTDGYLKVDIFGSYNFKYSDGSHKIIFQFNNIFNETYYNHLSKIKLIMPEPARNISLQYRFLF